MNFMFGLMVTHILQLSVKFIEKILLNTEYRLAAWYCSTIFQFNKYILVPENDVLEIFANGSTIQEGLN